ncbi:MAG: hypothetical protein IJ493_09870 [Clostridia bacterium]|nr:hypothetical protein [Clostridia bacterium]
MKTLNVKILSSADIDWAAQEKALIDIYKWGGSFQPEAWGQVAYVKTGDEKEGVYVHFFCAEANPRAIYHKHNEPVFKDSCMEFFFTMNDPDKSANGYINIESNSDPTTLIAYGHDRYDRTPIMDMGIKPFALTSNKTDSTWELFEFVPLAVLQKVFGITEVNEQTVFKANLYKCGGDHQVLPYGSWAEIDSPTPDFHRPEFFGELKLVK